ncbi:YibE/F family protein [Enterococcus malodoratus]|uniref:YibE/F family protein n=1 Tax=Enterococcus malodoratus TaxID=71451 RepID=UPI003FD50D4E
MKKRLTYIIALSAIILLGFFIQAKSSIFYSEPVMRVEKVEVNSAANTQKIAGKLLNQKGNVTLETSYYKNESISPLYRKGNQLILQKSGNYWRVLEMKRDGYVFILIGLFIWIILLISRKKGIFALIGLAINSLLLLLVLWLNQQNGGWSLMLLMGIYTFVAIFIAMGTSYGFKNLDVRKIFGTLVSVFLAFFICLIAMNFLKDSGLRYEEMQFITRPYRSVFLAGLLIGAIGASMDNVVTIISTLDEIRAQNEQLSLKKLMQSGREVAQDTASSMINVLMFAYLSGAIPSFVFYMANGWNFPDVIGMHLSLEILRTLCGGFAIVLSVPAALLAFSVSEKLGRRASQ